MTNTLPRKKKTYPIQVAQATHPGLVRERNEDSHGWFSTAAGELFVVADGMGGHAGGETASRLAVESVSGYVLENAESGRPPSDLIKEALFAADKAISDAAREELPLRGMGSTAAILLVKEPLAWFIHAGDSRIYLYADGLLQRITKDHSLVQLMMDMGEISPEEVPNFEGRSVITRSLGGNLNAGTMEVMEMDCYPGDQFLLCSDGLTATVSDDGIGEVLASVATVRDKVERLMEMALKGGGIDNVTVQLAAIPPSGTTIDQSAEELSRDGSKPEKPISGYLGLITILVLGILMGSLGTFFYLKSLRNAAGTHGKGAATVAGKAASSPTPSPTPPPPPGSTEERTKLFGRKPGGSLPATGAAPAAKTEKTRRTPKTRDKTPDKTGDKNDPAAKDEVPEKDDSAPGLPG
ncbi:MAG: protein phosphatase 2C domain-containing protein [Deltaproteobacteria bacterium]|jgi:protein phosphatase|nr:protein phosphatase 2C domain-containing protein [Deltaproteobacteria bacterium]